MEQVLTPKLRFPEFENDWKKSIINTIASKLNVGFVGACEPYYTNKSEGVLLIRTGNLKGVNIVLDDVKYVTKEFHEKNKKSQVYPDDLLLARHGGNGEICRVPEKFPSSNCLNIVILRTNSELNSIFFQLVYNTSFIQRQIYSVTAGSTQSVINTKEIGKLKIAYPFIVEQQKIASFLSEVDKKLNLLQQKKRLLEDYKKGVMQQIFSQELRFQPKDGGKYPKWEEKKLGEVATFTKGKGVSKNDISKDGKIECIRYGELYTHYGEVISKVISKTNVDIESLVLSHANDVIIPSSGETQIDIATASCVLNEGIALGGDLNIIRSNFNGVFLSYYLNSVKKHDIARLSQGVSVVHLYASQLSKLVVEIPSKEEQTQIANFLSALDEKIQWVSSQIEQTQQFKKGLLQKMFV